MRVAPFLMALPLLAGPVGVSAQDLLQRAYGCYDVEIGPWTPALDLGADSLSLAPPTRVVLDTISNSEEQWRYADYYQLRVAPGALPSIHPYSGWIAMGDSIRLVWNDFSGLAARVREAPGGFTGTAYSIWDFSREQQTAPFSLERVPCESPVPISVEDARPLPSSLSLSNGTRLELAQTFTPSERWEARRPRTFVLRDVEIEGFGLVESLQVRTDESEQVVSILGILPEDADFHSHVRRLVEEWGQATDTDERTLRSGRGHRSAVWNNRIVSLWVMSGERPAGTWQTHFSLRLEGRT